MKEHGKKISGKIWIANGKNDKKRKKNREKKWKS